MNISDILRRNALRFPKQVVWEDSKKAYTYSDMENASGKVYRYLKSKSIGREDIVAIRLPRSAAIPQVMLGVWKAGAAFVVIGEHTAEELAACQLEETKPKLIFDLQQYELAMCSEYLSGYEKADPHDLACVVYSTGSSGRFKGSMHEYGALQAAIFQYVRYLLLGFGHKRYLFTAGFYTISAVCFLVSSIVSRDYFYAVPYESIGNPKAIQKLLLDQKIQSYTTARNNLTAISELQSPYMKQLNVSMEVFTYSKKLKCPVYNLYGMTESIIPIAYFKIDQSYDICPVGKPYPEFKTTFLDKFGKKVPKGKIGEFCFVPKYYRGYIAQPEKTKAVLHDGWFHTGDMGYINPKGKIVILGRKIDLFETKNGYIVPIQVSSACQRAFPDVKDCYVKVFDHGDRPEVCLYYRGEIEHPLSQIREALKKVIPEYSLPTHSLKVEAFEYYPSGKINRNSFRDLSE